MAKAFRSVQNYVESRYPEFTGNVYGMNYPPPPFAQLFAQFAGYLFVAGLILLFGGSTIFATFGSREPAWFQTMKQNQMATFFGLFMLNNIGASMLATGAFEIFVDGELVFSKLATGSMPNEGDLISIFSKYNK
jgi:selT/selW/selH-like putative selenoprotein